MGLAKQTLWHGMRFVVFSILGGVIFLVICIANWKSGNVFDFSIQKIGLCWVMLVIQTFRCREPIELNLEPGIEPIETVAVVPGAMTGIAVHTFQWSHMCHDPTLALLDVCLLDHIKSKFFLTEHELLFD